MLSNRLLRALVTVVLVAAAAGCTPGPVPLPGPPAAPVSSSPNAGPGPGAVPKHEAKKPPKPSKKPDKPEKIVYLTFDDGPDPRWTPKMLKVLDAHDAHATFFELGAAAHSYPGLVKKVRASGSKVGSHTWHHYDLTYLSNSGIDTELRSTDRALGGQIDCVRPPYGATSSRVRQRIRKNDQRQVLWDVDPRDWSRPGSKTIERRVLKAVRPGSVVLLHDGGGGDRSQTVTALEVVLENLDARGYRVEAIPGC